MTGKNKTATALNIMIKIIKVIIITCICFHCPLCSGEPVAAAITTEQGNFTFYTSESDFTALHKGSKALNTIELADENHYILNFIKNIDNQALGKSRLYVQKQSNKSLAVLFYNKQLIAVTRTEEQLTATDIDKTIQTISGTYSKIEKKREEDGITLYTFKNTQTSVILIVSPGSRSAYNIEIHYYPQTLFKELISQQ